MRKIIFILSLIFFVNLALFSQTNYEYSEKYSAICNMLGDANTEAFKISIDIQNDSIIIESIINNQCCPEFALQISDFVNDTLYVVFLDTTTMMCDCMCDFEVKINAGKFESNVTIINFNGINYKILPANYMPLVEVGKKWNSLCLIPGLENTLPTQLIQTIETDELYAFCWNGKKYYKVTTNYNSYSDYINPSDTISKYIREENGKVYRLDNKHISFDGCDEFLIYDFTVNVGDTVELGIQNIKYVVVPIEISEIQGRRCIALADLTESQMSDYTIWVEGIGDLRGLFNSTESLYMCGAMNVLACCSINDTCIYQNNKYPNCGERPPYQFFIQEGKQWTTVTNCFLDVDTSFVSEVNILNSNIDNNIYAKRFYQYPNNKNIYFQEENGLVYYNEEDKHFLIYDFTKNEGDTIKVQNSFDQGLTLYVDSVRYIKYYDNNFRKTLYLSGDINTTWIEGIGDINSPLDYWMEIPPCGCRSNFACCSLNGELLYQNSQYPNCGIITSIESIKQNHINIYPNPSNGLISIYGLDGIKNNEYEIYNSIGKLVQHGKLQTVLNLSLKNGIYLMKISNGFEIKSEKLIIK